MRIQFIADPEIERFFDDVFRRRTEVELEIDRHYHRFVNSRWAWVAQTALLLREAGYMVSMGEGLREDCVNIGLAADIRRLPRSSQYFRVSIDADQLRARWANFFLVQNQSQEGYRSIWVPHWPQPGLLSRDPRRDGFRNVVFFGLPRNLARGADWWTRVCRRHGMNFDVRPPERWNDYRDVDVAIGVRQFGFKRFSNKPPTKLFNAWLARSVFIAGADSAYPQVGEPGREFLVGADEKSIDQYLDRLSKESGFGEDIIRNGSERVKVVGSRAAAVERWSSVLDNQVERAFREWSAMGRISRGCQVYFGLLVDRSVRGRNSVWRAVKKVRGL